MWRTRGQAHVMEQRIIRPLPTQQVIRACMHARQISRRCGRLPIGSARDWQHAVQQKNFSSVQYTTCSLLYDEV